MPIYMFARYLNGTANALLNVVFSCFVCFCLFFKVGNSMDPDVGHQTVFVKATQENCSKLVQTIM